MSKFKRVLSAFLVLIMLVGMVPGMGITSNAAITAHLWVYYGECTSTSFTYGWAHANPWMAASFGHSNAANSIKGVLTNYSKAYNDLNNPNMSKTGYHYAGFYYIGGSQASIQNGTGLGGFKLTDVISVPDQQIWYMKPGWDPNTYTIKYNANGGSGSMSNTSATYDSSVTLRANSFTRSGYTFSGWATSSSGSKAYNDKASVKNLTATNGGTVNLYAVWTKAADPTYTITLDPNGGTMASGYKTSYTGVKNGQTYTQIFGSYPQATKTGYTLKCWDWTGGNFDLYSTGMGNTFTVGANSTFKAVWNANTYTVNYDGNGATGGSTASSSHTYDTAKALTSNGFTRTDYTFTGWNTKADGSGTSYANGASVSNLTSSNGGTVTLYAQWSRSGYTTTFKFHLNGGTASGLSETTTITYPTSSKQAMAWTDIYNYGNNKATFDKIFSVTKSGYALDYFKYTTPNLNDGIEFKALSPGDGSVISADYCGTTMELTAQWKQGITLHAGPEGNGATYTMKIDSDGNTALPTSKADIAALGLAPNNSKKGLDQRVLIGWFTDYDSTTSRGTGTEYWDNYSGTSPVTLYAIWGFPIQFSANGGTFSNGSTTYENYVTSYTANGDAKSLYRDILPGANGVTISRPGYELRLYNGDEAYALTYTDNTICVWEGPKQYLTIPPTGGSAEGNTATWSMFICGTTKWGTAPQFQAVWEPIISYNPNGGSGSTKTEVIEFDWGDVDTGYNSYSLKSVSDLKFTNNTDFVEWNTKADGTGTSYRPGASVGGTNSAPLTLYAIWANAPKINVTFYANDGTGNASSASFTVGSTFGTLPAPTRTGYTFEGWFDRVQGGTQITVDSTVPNDDNFALWARWEKKVTPPPTDRTVFQFHAGEGGHIHDYSEFIQGNGVHLEDPWIENTGGQDDKWNLGQPDGTGKYYEVTFEYLYYAHMWTQQAPYYDRDNYKINDAGTAIVPIDPNLPTISSDPNHDNWNIVFSSFNLISKAEHIFLGYDVYIDDDRDGDWRDDNHKLVAYNASGFKDMSASEALAAQKAIGENYFPDYDNDGYFDYSDFSYKYYTIDGNDAGTATLIPKSMVGNYVHFVAHWKYGKLNITFDHNDGQWKGQGSHSYQVFSGQEYNEVLTEGIPQPTKDGAIFAGSYSVWTGEAYDSTRIFSLSADNFDKAVCTFGQDTTFYADYTYCNYTETVTKAATCTEDGIMTHTCNKTAAGHENHNYSYTSTIGKLGHDWGEWTQTKAPTCTAEGTETRICNRISSHVETREVAATGHKMDSGVVTTPATCTDDGVKTYTCQNGCGHTTTETITKLGHDMGAYEYNGDANCTTDGTETSKCSRCDETDTRTAAGTKYGHKVELVPDKCVAWKYYGCGQPYEALWCCSNANCPDRKSTEEWRVQGISPAHNYELTDSKAATCTEPGYNTYTCYNKLGDAVCNDTYTDTVSAKGHNMGNWYTTVEPTYDTVGEERRDCTRCDHFETRELAIKVDDKAPTGTIAIQNGTFWDKLLTSITFGIYTNDKYVITITAKDVGSGVNKIEYYRSETPLTENEVKNSTLAWAPYNENAKPTYTEHGNHVVYAKITDNAGNVTYISTDGLVIDNIAPKIEGLIDGHTYCGVASVPYDYSDEHFESITVTLSNGASCDTSSKLLAGSPTGESYTVVATDKAGNVTTYNVTVYSTHDYVGEVTTKPTCTGMGVMTYTCSRCNDSYPEDIMFTGHDWVNAKVDYTWTEDYTECTATRYCNNDASHTEEETVTAKIVTVDADCEKPGKTTYTATFTKDWAVEQTKEFELEIIDHDWNEPTYVWNAEHTVCTATRVCKRYDTHIETAVSVEVTSEITKPATCTETGDTTYTATFTEDWADTQTETVIGNVPALDHDWTNVEPTYTWAEDMSTCTATRVCGREGCEYTEEETVTVVVTEDPATCLDDGLRTYTATFTNTWADEQVKEEVIPATGHKWGETSYVWADDHSSCTATRICEYQTGPACTETETTENISYEILTPHTCVADGEGEYTATFVNEWAGIHTETVAIPADPNDPNAHPAEFGMWMGESCDATCTEGGTKITSYWCFIGCGLMYEVTEQVDALGHNWKDATVTYDWIKDENGVWNKCVATRVCANNTEDSCIETSESGVTSVTVDATCTTDGSITYTAEFVEEGVDLDWTVRQAKVEPINKLGHTPGETVIENLKKATCEKNGSYDEVVYCTVCEAEVSRTVVPIAVFGQHDYTTECDECPWIVTKEPTFFENGERIKYCHNRHVYDSEVFEDCGTFITEVIPKLNDDVKPVVTITEPDHDVTDKTIDYDKDGMNVTITASDANSGLKSATYTVTKDGVVITENVEIEIVDGVATVTYVLDDNGEYVITVVATDNVGLTTEVTSDTLVIDKVAPDATLTPSAGVEKPSNEKVTVEVVATDNLSGVKDVEYYISATPVEDTDTITDWTDITDGTVTVEAEGENYVYVKVTDEAGNTKVVAADKITIDYTDPTIRVTVTDADNTANVIDSTTDYISEPENKYTNKDALVTIEPESETDTVGYITVVPYTGTVLTKEELEALDSWTEGLTTTLTEDGEYVVYIKTTDEAGNTTYVNTNVIVIDTEKPVISEDLKVLYCATESVTFPVSDNYAGFTVEIDGVKVEADENGGYTVYGNNGIPQTIKVTDLAGNVTEFVITVYKNHTPGEAVIENNVEPTCTAGGSYEEVVYCTVCNAELSRTKVTVKELGHIVGEWEEITTPATCDKKGSIVRRQCCTVCGELLDETVTILPKTSHDWGEWVVTTAPTCTEDGVETRTCNNFAHHKSKRTVPATGHTAGDKVVENYIAPTCTAEGSYEDVVYCSVCDAELSRTKVPVKALGHTEGEYVVISETPATCENSGSVIKAMYCTVCNEKLDETVTFIPKTGHDYAVTEHKDATCTEDGYDVYTCKNDESHTYTVKIDKLGHTAGDKVVENYIAPTCTAEGTYEDVVYCTVCDAELSRTKVTVKELGHTKGEWVVESNTPATCTANGAIIKALYCTVCNEKIDEAVEILFKTGHDYEVTEHKDATCTEDGYDVYTCNNDASHTYTVVIDKLGHDEVAHEAKAPTCTEIGWDAYVTCTRCDYTTKVEKPATGHTAGDKVVENNKPATCEENGSYDVVVYCTVCNAELSRNTEKVPATGHTKGEYVVIKHEDATCEKNGVHIEEMRCTVCDKVLDNKTQVLYKTGHDYEVTEHKDATCTEDGYDVYTCKNDASHTYTVVIDKLGHDEVAHEAKAPTCTEIGWDAYVTCTRCDYTTKVEKPATGHTAGDKVVENYIAPTCTAEGTYEDVVYCTVCNAELSRTKVTVKELGHTKGEWVVESNTPATCTENGAIIKALYCTVCNEKIDEAVEILFKTGHNYVGEVTTEATCTEAGVKTYTCTHDASHTYTEEIAALGHDEVAHEAKAPTCTEIGWDAYVTCTRCDYTTKVEIPAHGHTAGDAVIENEVEMAYDEATGDITDGGYDTVVYCTVCKVQLERERTTFHPIAYNLQQKILYTVDTFQKGLDDAETGERIIMIDCATVDGMQVTDTRTVYLDLNGFVLTVDGSISMNLYAHVVDFSEGDRGRLIVDEGQKINERNRELSIWDDAIGGYYFIDNEVIMQQLKPVISSDGSSVTLTFRPIITDRATTESFFSDGAYGTADALQERIKIGVVFDVIDANGNKYEDIKWICADTLVQICYNPDRPRAFEVTLDISGCSFYSVKSIMISDLGVIRDGETVTGEGLGGWEQETEKPDEWV